MAKPVYTVTTDEWIVARLVASVAPGTDPVETIETLRTLREHVGGAALGRGFDLDDACTADKTTASCLTTRGREVPIDLANGVDNAGYPFLSLALVSPRTPLSEGATGSSYGSETGTDCRTIRASR